MILILQAWDSDLGFNAELRYKLISVDDFNGNTNERDIFTVNEVYFEILGKQIIIKLEIDLNTMFVAVYFSRHFNGHQ